MGIIRLTMWVIGVINLLTKSPGPKTLIPKPYITHCNPIIVVSIFFSIITKPCLDSPSNKWDP